jgi:hypothetical protein
LVGRGRHFRGELDRNGELEKLWSFCAVIVVVVGFEGVKADFIYSVLNARGLSSRYGAYASFNVSAILTDSKQSVSLVLYTEGFVVAFTSYGGFEATRSSGVSFQL